MNRYRFDLHKLKLRLRMLEESRLLVEIGVCYGEHTFSRFSRIQCVNPLFTTSSSRLERDLLFNLAALVSSLRKSGLHGLLVEIILIG